LETLTRSAAGEIVGGPPVSEEREHPKLGLLRPVQVISTVSGGSIIGALYYLHVKNLLESKTDAEIVDADYVKLVRAVEEEYREAAASNVCGSGWANLLGNFMNLVNLDKAPLRPGPLTTVVVSA
jgi:hypothetical protein